jgi:HTH-type transcriptional regulator/antitoxin HigA
MQEKKADSFASEFLLSQTRLKSFINRHYPNISQLRIAAFAVRNKVHPGIVVGQYHYQTKRYTHFRKFLVKIKKYITETALTDGFGSTISV